MMACKKNENCSISTTFPAHTLCVYMNPDLANLMVQSQPRMNNTGQFASNTIPIQYWAPSIALQYRTNTKAILN